MLMSEEQGRADAPSTPSLQQQHTRHRRRGAGGRARDVVVILPPPPPPGHDLLVSGPTLGRTSWIWVRGEGGSGRVNAGVAQDCKVGGSAGRPGCRGWGVAEVADSSDSADLSSRPCSN